MDIIADRKRQSGAEPQASHLDIPSRKQQKTELFKASETSCRACGGIWKKKKERVQASQQP